MIFALLCYVYDILLSNYCTLYHNKLISACVVWSARASRAASKLTNQIARRGAQENGATGIYMVGHDVDATTALASVPIGPRS